MPRALTIMVVDDDADGRYLLEHRLKKAFKECTVVACAAPTEALAMLRTGRVDAIITDNQFEWDTGPEFIMQARRRGLACPILMVTSSDDSKVERDAFAAGATQIFMGGRGDFTEFLRQLFTRAEGATETDRR